MTIKTVRETTLRLILEHDHTAALALFDALHLSSADALRLLAEIEQLRAQGAPEAAFRAWHHDLCEYLRRQIAEADARAQADAWLPQKPS